MLRYVFAGLILVAGCSKENPVFVHSSAKTPENRAQDMDCGLVSVVSPMPMVGIWEGIRFLTLDDGTVFSYSSVLEIRLVEGKGCTFSFAEKKGEVGVEGGLFLVVSVLFSPFSFEFENVDMPDDVILVIDGEYISEYRTMLNGKISYEDRIEHPRRIRIWKDALARSYGEGPSAVIEHYTRVAD